MASEIRSLLELASKQGLDQATLIESAKKDILIEYYRTTPKGPKDASVLIDPHTDIVRIYSQDKDITPPSFAAKAVGIARQSIINQLHQKPHGESYSPPPKTISLHPNLSSYFGHLIFWGYNSIFILYGFLFLTSFLSADFRDNIIDQLRELGIAPTILGLIILATPAAVVFYAIKRRLHRQPQHLLKLFFLLEIPLLLIAYFSLTLLPQTSPALFFFGFTLMLFPLTIYAHTQTSDDSAHTLPKLVLHQTVLTTTSYLTLIFSFFIPLIIGATAAYSIGNLTFQFFRNATTQLITFDFFSIVGTIISFSLGGILILAVIALTLLPFLVLQFLVRRFITHYRQLAADRSSSFANRVVALTAIIYFLIAGLASIQFHHQRYLDLLTNANTGTYADRAATAKELQTHPDAVRRTVLDANMFRSRYLWNQDNNFLSQAYQTVLNFDPTYANYLQFTLNNIAYPFVYRGSYSDIHSLAGNYRYVFGTDLKQTTTTPPEPPIKLIHREITATTSATPLLATVTITDKFDNTSTTQQEVIYEFNLPEGSVITDLKLGPELEFEGIIAPRGAAQQTYERELNRSRDPALLEQTGPRQYRLRVFPIPGKNDRTTLSGRNQQVQFTYITPLTSAGYALPDYHLRENLQEEYPVAATLNEKYVQIDHQTLFIPATTLDACQLSEPFSFSQEGRTYTLTPQYVSHPDCTATAPTLEGKRIALFYDTSYTNQSPLDQELKQYFSKYPEISSRNSIDLILYSDVTAQPITLTPNNLDEVFDIVQFGTCPSQGNPLSKYANDNYDYFILVTGNTDNLYPYGDQFNIEIAPMYIIHTGSIPAYNQSSVVSMAKKDIRIIDSVAQAFAVIGAKQHAVTDSQLLIHTPELSLTVSPALPLSDTTWINVNTNPAHPATYLAAQSVYLAYLATIPNPDAPSLAFLDSAQWFADRAHLVTPFTSLISLVNHQQLEALKRELLSARRFQETPMQTNISRSGPISFDDSVPLRGIDLGGSSGGFFGLGLRAPKAGSPTMPGDVGLGVIGTHSALSTYPYLIGLGSFSTLFIIANTILLTAGTTIYLIKTLRRKSK